MDKNHKKILYRKDLYYWKKQIYNHLELWKEIRNKRDGFDICITTWNIQCFKNASFDFVNENDFFNFIKNDLNPNILCLQEYGIESNNFIESKTFDSFKNEFNNLKI